MEKGKERKLRGILAGKKERKEIKRCVGWKKGKERKWKRILLRKNSQSMVWKRCDFGGKLEVLRLLSIL